MQIYLSSSDSSLQPSDPTCQSAYQTFVAYSNVFYPPLSWDTYLRIKLQPQPSSSSCWPITYGFDGVPRRGLDLALELDTSINWSEALLTPGSDGSASALTRIRQESAGRTSLIGTIISNQLITSDEMNQPCSFMLSLSFTSGCKVPSYYSANNLMLSCSSIINSRPDQPTIKPPPNLPPDAPMYEPSGKLM